MFRFFFHKAVAMPAEPHITIVGGGFSGAAVAIHLLDLMPEGYG